MTVGSLFAGIGGFELAAQWAGLKPVWSNEIDPYCCAVLRKNFKHEIIEADIKTIGKDNLKPVDIITGGFPCQPFSSAGKRKGKEDVRHLWPEMLRIIGEIRPSYVVGENVRGLLNWNGGMVFEEVQIDLENKGYQVASYLLPACGVQAPHNRARIFIIAHINSVRCFKSQFKWHSIQWREFSFRETNPGNSKVKHLTNFNTQGLSFGFQRWKRGIQIKAESFKRGEYTRGNSTNKWQKFPTQSPILRGNDGVPNRVDRIKSLGNAIVPQVAFEIFKAIKEVNA